jgi:hypothetical protein
MAEEPITATPPATEPVTTPPAEEPAQAPTDGEKPEAKTLTQDEIDEMISKRVAREKQKAAEDRAAIEKQIAERDELLKSYRDKEDALKREQEEKERKRLEEKGEFEKLIALDRDKADRDRKALEEAKAAAEAERDTWKKELEMTKIDNQLLAAFSADAVDPEAAVQLFKNAHTVTLDPKTFQVMVDGDSDTTLQATAQAFLSKRDYLSKSQYAGKTGAGSPPASTAAAAVGNTYTRAQYADYAFYQANKADMDKAQVEGRVTD